MASGEGSTPEEDAQPLAEEPVAGPDPALTRAKNTSGAEPAEPFLEPAAAETPEPVRRPERPALAALRAPHTPGPRIAAVLAEVEAATPIAPVATETLPEEPPVEPADRPQDAPIWQLRMPKLPRTLGPRIRAAFTPVPQSPSETDSDTPADGIAALGLDSPPDFAEPAVAPAAPETVQAPTIAEPTPEPAVEPQPDLSRAAEADLPPELEPVQEARPEPERASQPELAQEPEPAPEPQSLAEPEVATVSEPTVAGPDSHSVTPQPTAADGAVAPATEPPRGVRSGPIVTQAMLEEARTIVAARIETTRARIAAVCAPAAPAKASRAPESRIPSRAPRRTSAKPVRIPAPERDLGEMVLRVEGLTKRFGEQIAVDDVGLEVNQGSFYGIVGPNGAGKTTTLSMITGLLRPDSGRVLAHGVDVWKEPAKAKRIIGVLPDALRLFDRLTGAQLLYYSGALRGLDNETVRARAADLAAAFGIEDAIDRLVADYSAGMTKKIALAAAMIHSPRLLVLDEPFESVDPVSAVNLNEILQRYVASGGTVVLSSHGMDFIQRVCDHVAIIVNGRVLSAGTMDEVRGSASLEERFVELAGGRKAAEGMEWLHSFTD